MPGAIGEPGVLTSIPELENGLDPKPPLRIDGATSPRCRSPPFGKIPIWFRCRC